MNVKAAKYEIQNLQLVAQHRFVASFGWCFSFSPCVTNLTRNKNICCGLKNLCSAMIGWIARARAHLFEQQSQNLLLEVELRSTFRNNFLQPATNVFAAWQVNHERWKTGNINQNLQRNNVACQVEGFCISYFAAFRNFNLVLIENGCLHLMS